MHPEEITKVETLRKYAVDHCIPLEVLRQRAICYAQGKRVAGFNSHTTELSGGVRLTFTIEQHVAGPVRHMSVSCSDIRRTPSPDLVRDLMVHLGFLNPITECLQSYEYLENGALALNIFEPAEASIQEFFWRNTRLSAGLAHA